MRIFDSHCHFEIDGIRGISEQLTRAKAAGVSRLLAVGGSVKLSANAALAAKCAAELGEASPQVFCAFGIDRDQLSVSVRERSLCLAPPEAPPPTAIGEIGLDYHYSPESRKAQCKNFAEQLQLASESRLPVIIHTREAAADTIALLKETPSNGIIHCFTGLVDEARAYLDLGFYVSISGIVTFHSADAVRETARFLPADRILIETDAPYLAPVPLRGRPNEPSYIRHTCEFISALRGMPAEEFAEQTYANATKALGLR